MKTFKEIFENKELSEKEVPKEVLKRVIVRILGADVWKTLSKEAKEKMFKKYKNINIKKTNKWLDASDLVTESNGKKEYDEYFQSMLKKWKVDSPEDLSDEDKKKFFDAVDKGWKAKKETD